VDSSKYPKHCGNDRTTKNSRNPVNKWINIGSVQNHYTAVIVIYAYGTGTLSLHDSNSHNLLLTSLRPV
jgi:hypothetical protein